MSGREKTLFCGADTIGLTGATWKAGTRVVTVAATVSRLNVRKGGVVTIFVDVHAIADSRAELNRVGKDAGHGARSYIDYVVNGTAPLGKTSQVSRQETETLLASHRGRGMPVFSLSKSAIGPVSFGPQPGQIGAVYCTSGSRSTRGAGGIGMLRTELNKCASNGSRN